jgi:hypothetical protein
VSPVKYEMDFYIPEDDILHSDSSEKFKSSIFAECFTVGLQLHRGARLQGTSRPRSRKCRLPSDMNQVSVLICEEQSLSRWMGE